MIDFLHIYTGDQNIPNFHIHNSNYSGPDQPRKNSNASDHQKPPNEGNFHDQHEQESLKEGEHGIYDQMTPLVGYTLRTNSCLLKMYSLRIDKSLHVIRFNSPVIKFQTNVHSTSNQMIVLLQEGLLKIFNLQTLDQE